MAHNTWFVMLALTLAATAAEAAGPCVFSASELQEATGRSFDEGQPGKDVTGQYEQCTYAEAAQPKRKVIVSVRTQAARQQYEAQRRLLHFGKEPIDLPGVGDAAYFNGTAAGVLKGERALLVSNLRRASDPKIDRDKVVRLLQAALKRSGFE